MLDSAQLMDFFNGHALGLPELIFILVSIKQKVSCD